MSAPFFDGTFLPFVGADLQFAVLQVTFKFEGNVLAGSDGSSASVNFGGLLALNGISYNGDGAGNSTGGAPGSSNPLTVTMINTSSNLIGNSLNPVFATYVKGSSPFNFTYGTAPVSPANFTLGGVGSQLTGTLTSTEVLTYSYSGEGALLQVDVPEPASLALMAAGVLGLLGARRRQA